MDQQEILSFAPIDWAPESVLAQPRDESVDLERSYCAAIPALQDCFIHYHDSKQLNHCLLDDALIANRHPFVIPLRCLLDEYLMACGVPDGLS